MYRCSAMELATVPADTVLCTTLLQKLTEEGTTFNNC
jgi:hypothetical protein